MKASNLDKPFVALQDDDPTAVSRKKDHIELAFQSQVAELDERFYYEPLLAAHPKEGSWPQFEFLGREMRAPLWVSSMTGGTALASTINHNLARAAGEFGFGMGLGSCRSLLSSDEYLPDFDVRDQIGDDLPLYANLGIAQVEQLVLQNNVQLALDMVDKLRADGLIIHINPLQEWLQPEGDRFEQSPFQTIEQFMEQTDMKIIVKEVGQGMGLESMRALLQLPLEAIDFAANGGTNFAKLELLRGDAQKRAIYSQLANVGHSATDMVGLCNQLVAELGDRIVCKQIIVSGGISNFLDGYYHIGKMQLPAIYGQASAFLKHARGDYETLQRYVATQIRGLELAKAFLRLR